MVDWHYIGGCFVSALTATMAMSIICKRKHKPSLPVELGRPVRIDYTNWRGERRIRLIEPLDLVFKKSEWHPGEQWFIEALDIGKSPSDPDKRDFALANIHQWIDSVVDAHEMMQGYAPGDV